MDFENIKTELKERLTDYVESITEKSKGANMYICPICGSGTGHNHTGAFSIDRARNKWKCFSCGKGGDIFDLIGEVEHIDQPLEQLKRAGELFGVDVTGGREYKKPIKKDNKEMNIHTYTYTQTDTEDYSAYYNECAERLKDTDYHTKRGISTATAERFSLGYDPNFITGGAVWKALIIPVSSSSYVARNTDTSADSKDRYRKTGKQAPFNIEAIKTATKPIYIVEGELDALSIIEAGGEAIALGSTAYLNRFIDYLKENTPKQPVVIALDNDTAGEKAGLELAHKLAELDIEVYEYNPAREYKDANEALTADRENFIQWVNHIEAVAEEQQEEERAEYYKTSAGGHIQDFLDGIKAHANTPAQPTGFFNLDSIALDGGLYEGLYIIGAISSLGKTTLALQIADQIAQSGADVLIFSLEMARAELMSKSISRHTLLEVMATDKNTHNAKTSRGITDGGRYEKYSLIEREIIQNAVEAYSKYADHIFIQEGLGDIGVKEIWEQVEKHKKITGKTPVILIDYLQILAPYDVRATDKQNTDKAVLELKRISRKYKTPVIAISSFNRTNYKMEVSEEAFKESGGIEYGSDVLIGLQLEGAGQKDFDSKTAKRKDPRNIELVIIKNRNGKMGDTIKMKYYPLFNYFEESEE